MKYDAIKHAKILVKETGVCDGPVDCDICFRRADRGKKEFTGCSPEDAYEDALEFLEKKGESDKCVSIW